MSEKKILYVEDDLSLIEGLKYTLEKNGFLVDNARTVKEAYQFFLFYMTNDFQKTMVEHDYGMAGYLVKHPDSNVAAAFTKDKTDSDLKAGKQVLKEAGYHENTDPRMVPAVAAYQKRTTVMLGGMLFSVFAAVFLTVWIYIRRQRKALAKADTVITRFLEGDTGQRVRTAKQSMHSARNPCGKYAGWRM